MEAAKIPDSETNWNTVDIFLFSNGQENSPPRKYHLTSRDLEMWPATLMFLARTQYGAMHYEIQLFTIDGEPVGPMQISNGSTYVAVKPPEAFIQSGYETYLLKASRSWEKRQAKINSYCNVCLDCEDNGLNGHQRDKEIGTVLPSEEITHENVDKNKVEKKLNTTLAKPENKTGQLAYFHNKSNNNKRKPPQLHLPEIKHNHTKTANVTSNKNNTQYKNVNEKNRSKVIRRPTIISPLKRGVNKTQTAEKLKETESNNMKHRAKTNNKPLKAVDSPSLATSIPQNKTSIVSSTIDDDVKVLLARITDSVLNSSTCTQNNNVVFNKPQSEQTNTDNLMVIEVNSMCNDASVSKAANYSNELEILTIHENQNNNAISIKSSFIKNHNLLDDIHKTSSGQTFNYNPNAAVNENAKLEGFKSKPTEESNVISKPDSYYGESKQDVINLLLRIKLKSRDDKKIRIEKESQANFDMDFMLNSKTLVSLLDEDTEKEDNGANPKVVVVQCTCNESRNDTNNVLNDKLQAYTIVIPIFNCERCKNEQQDCKEPDIPSNVPHNIVSVQKLNETNIGDTTIDTCNEFIKSQVNWLTDKLNITNGEDIDKESLPHTDDKQDYLTIQKRIPKETTDNSSQTEWCNILLETRRQEDGHYSFHLPTLEMLKSYKLNE